MTLSPSTARLIESRQTLAQGSRNRRARALFLPREPELVHDKFREVPRPLGETAGKIPVVACLDRPLAAKLLGFPLDRHYRDPSAFLEDQLRMDVFQLEYIPDDQFVDESIQVWGGPGFEASLFGMRQEYSPDNEPWLRHEPIVDGPRSLDSLPEASWWTSGPMPSVLDFHLRLCSLLDGTGLRAIPPGWIRGPLGVAEELRGIENLVMDAVLNPEFVRDLLRRVVDFRKAWCSARAAFLGCATPLRGLLYNDEVQVPMISPRIYRDFVLPCEKELHDFHGGLHYWHSCGDAAPFLSLVDELPDITMIQCGAFTEPEKVVSVFCQRTALEMAVRPMDDFVRASEDEMRARVEYYVRLCRQYSAKAAMIRLTVYETQALDPWSTLAKAIRWVEIAREAVEETV